LARFAYEALIGHMVLPDLSLSATQLEVIIGLFFRTARGPGA
jgi:hypothetical protein